MDLHLDAAQERVLRGEEGEAKQLAMELVTQAGDAAGADSLVPIVSAHVLARQEGLKEEGIALLERFAGAGGRFAVPTTVDPASVDLEKWKSFGIPEEHAEKQFRLCRAYARLGGIPCWTCVQYQVCNFPKPGEAVSWAGASSVVFANSLIGCKTNRVASGLDLASAITGLTPRSGMILDENRVARVSFGVDAGGLSDLDYRSVGFFVGKNSGQRVPAIVGVPETATSDDLKHLGAAAASAGSLSMMRFVGISLATATLSEATGGESVERMEIGRRELQSVEDELNETDEAPDLVALGAPHLSISELGDLARRLKGRRLSKGVKMYVYTSSQAFDMATRTGIASEIEGSGAKLTHTTDAELAPLKMLGFRVVLTNSAKLAEALSARGEVAARYSALSDILDEVTR